MSSTIKFVQAIADNNGETDTELVFKRGEIIVVIDTDTGSDGWWEGYLLRDENAGSGFFPQSFAVPIISSDQTPPDGVYVTAARALYDFSSDNPDDLPISQGNALLAAPVADSPEWTEATRGSRTGFVPSNYVQVADDNEIMDVLQELATLKSSSLDTAPPRPKHAVVEPSTPTESTPYTPPEQHYQQQQKPSSSMSHSSFKFCCYRDASSDHCCYSKDSSTRRRETLYNN